MQSFPIFFLWITRRLYYRGPQQKRPNCIEGLNLLGVINGRDDDFYWLMCIGPVHFIGVRERRSGVAPQQLHSPPLSQHLGFRCQLDWIFASTKLDADPVDRALVACVQFYRCCYLIYLCLLLITRKAFASTRLASIFTINPPAHRLLVLCTQTTERDIEP